MFRANSGWFIFQQPTVKVKGVELIGKGDDTFADSFIVAGILGYYFGSSMSRSKS